ncbi:MAG TPA: Nif3-like dinuclear metal center hexameric protein [Acidimicrobiia bacterium]|nr:Nif3-like dinuclear metal center hexameric protein [Acidimicrobiia bacterium]
MVTVADVLTVLEDLAPEARAASWDRVGLQIGDPAAPVTRIAVCHEVTPATVDRVVGDGVDLVVAYHPLLFRPTTRFVAGPSATGRAFRLASAGIALAVAHTNFDVAPGGSADALAEAVGVRDARGFGPVWGAGSVRIVTYAPSEAVESVTAAMADAGAGRHGAYSACSFRGEGVGAFTASEHASPATGRAGAVNREPEVRIEMAAPAGSADRVAAALVAAHPYEEPVYDVLDRRGEAGFVGRVGTLAEAVSVDDFAARVHRVLGGVVRIAGSGEVRRVAVVPGSGRDFLTAARGAGAEVIVTGDVGHHAAREAVEEGLAIVDPGHAATERPGVRKLYAAIAAAVPPAVGLTDDPDPWRSL